MKKIHSYIILGLGALSMTACKPNFNPEIASAGSADFSRYIAVGNSLTAGFADGTLYRSGQESSYPSILATQFMAVGGGDFRQPLLSSDQGFPGLKRVLGTSTNCSGVSSLGPVLFNGGQVNTGQQQADAASVASQGPFNNLGVPGIRAIDYIIPGYPRLNPYSNRFFSGGPTERPLEELRRSNPTFFTLWIGNNDVLAYATSGGSGGLSGTGLDQNAISNEAMFQMGFDSVLNIMTRNGAKGAVMNIPDVTAIPYFTTIPVRGLTLDSTQARQLTAAYAGTGIAFITGANFFVIEDTSVPFIRRRQIRQGELLTLTVPQDSIRCAGWGSQTPIPMRYVLDATEIENVRKATTAFNTYMQQRAAAKNLAFVDMNTFLKTLPAGILFNGVTYNPTFVSGGIFSLDGVHLTPRGYAIAANQMIRVINEKYGATVPLADINAYNGILFPNP